MRKTQCNRIRTGFEMKRLITTTKVARWPGLLGLALIAVAISAFGQTAVAQQADDVLRINTELVQTDVMVFDRKGQFVSGLSPDQFVLTLNGSPKKISIFESVIAGRDARPATTN